MRLTLLNFIMVASTVFVLSVAIDMLRGERMFLAGVMFCLFALNIKSLFTIAKLDQEMARLDAEIKELLKKKIR